MGLNILVIHGPNLQLLGKREPTIYGKLSLAEINRQLQLIAKQRKVNLRIEQSNHEGEIVDLIGTQGLEWADGILINPGAYTHTSIAIRDALSGIAKPVIEVHLSNIHARESFREKSTIAPIALGQICGLGIQSYLLGLTGLIEFIMNQPAPKKNRKNKIMIDKTECFGYFLINQIMRDRI